MNPHTITRASLPRDAAIRQDQERFGRGNVSAAGAAPRKPFVAKGHDAQLQAAQFGKNDVIVTLLSGAEIEGAIVRRDKWTITVLEFEAKDPCIIFKHAIETVVIKANPTTPTSVAVS